MTANSKRTKPSDVTESWAGGVPVIFLPGIVMPAALRYAPLLSELGDSARALVKDLEVYAATTPPAGYAIEREVEGISRAADVAGFDRFHLYGHSAGGACALAYVAAHPERVLSLALDEPASDFSPEARSALRSDLNGIAALPADEKLSTFLRVQLAPGVEPPSPPPGSPAAWMAHRPAGIDAFVDALLHYRLPPDRLCAFDRPMYYSHGSLSHPSWMAMRDRLASIFPDFTSDLYEGATTWTPPTCGNRPGSRRPCDTSGAGPAKNVAGQATRRMTMPYAEVNDIRMYYEAEGEGEPLLLLHGALGAVDPAVTSGWSALLPSLAARFRTFSLEHRGHGRTDNPAGKLSYGPMTEDIAAFIEQLDLASAHLAGFSDGATIGLALGMTRPELLRSLICVGANYCVDDHLQQGMAFFDTAALERESPEFAAELARRHDSHHHPGYWRELVQQVLDKPRHDMGYRCGQDQRRRRV